MKLFARGLRAVLSAVVILCVPLAHANIISVKFAGTAVNTYDPFGVQDGSPVYGGFWVDTSYFTRFDGDGGGSAYALFAYSGYPTGPAPDPVLPMHMSITAPVEGRFFDAMGYDDQIVLEQDASRQAVTFYADSHIDRGMLQLVGAPGAFFSTLDMADLHSGAVDLALSSAAYFYKAGTELHVALSSISFDDAEVPEPQSVALACIAMLGILIVRRRSAL